MICWRCKKSLIGEFHTLCFPEIGKWLCDECGKWYDDHLAEVGAPFRPELGEPEIDGHSCRKCDFMARID